MQKRLAALGPQQLVVAWAHAARAHLPLLHQRQQRCPWCRAPRGPMSRWRPDAGEALYQPGQHPRQLLPRVVPVQPRGGGASAGWPVHCVSQSMSHPSRYRADPRRSEKRQVPPRRAAGARLAGPVAPHHNAVLIATAQAWDDEMRERIARHQRDRAERVPGLQTLEEPRDLAAAVAPSTAPPAHAGGGGLPHAVAHQLDSCPLGFETMDLKQKQAQALEWKAQAAHVFG